MSRLRVALNLLWLVPGVVGGSESYAVSLLRHLERRDEVAATAFGLPAFVTAHRQLADSLHTVVAPLPPGRRVVRRVVVENGWLDRHTRGFDLVHHLGGIVPPGCRTRAVLTLHDLQYLTYPEYFSAVKRRYLASLQGRSLRQAAVVTTISEFTRTQALDRFDIAADKVVVVPPVVELPTAPSAADRQAARDFFGLPGDFVLYPAASYPHKNHETLLRAFALLTRGENRDVTLVLTGAGGAGEWGSAISSEAALASLAARLGVAERVRRLGYVSREHLDALYAEAALLAFPSRFEGFGLPVIEAMALGCPVVAADATALPEVVGRGEQAGGLLVDPGDVDGWANAIGRLLDDPAQRAALVASGHARARTLAEREPLDTLVAAYQRAAA